MRDLRTGPTTLNALGSHYQHQLQKQKLADLKMQQRADRVAEVIKAPTVKDAAAEAMINSSPVISDANAVREEE